MNKKKIFSYLFIGLLAVGATGTVTSCKDYDDDINTNKTAISDLQKQLTSLQSALNAAKADATAAHANFATKGDIKSLQTEMAKLATADALQKAIDQLKELINGKVDQATYDAKVKELKTAIDGIDSKLNTLGTSLDDLKDAQKAADANIKLQQKALEDLKKALTDGLATKADASEVEKLKEQITQLQSDIKALSGESGTLSELKGNMKKLSDKVDAFSTQINVLTVFLKHSLASLTFIPDYFNEGIEAALVPAYEGAYSETSDNKEFKAKGAATDLLFGDGVARYNVSPTSVDLLGSKVDFFSLASTVLTRAGENYVAPVNAQLTAEVLKENYKDGVLTVPFKADWVKINKLAADKLPVAALQISRGDTTVTSDYATVTAKKFKGMVVADNGSVNAVVDGAACNENVEGLKHLYTVWSQMTPANAKITHDVAYNSHLNLDSLTEVHVTDNGAERTLPAAELKALGLKIVYAPVDYTQGNNKTSETAHIQLTVNKDGQTVAYPRNVTSEGKTILDKEANNSSVGREPIVAVKVVDATTGKKVYAWGYIKIKIRTPKQAISQITTDPMTFTDDVYDNCKDAELTTTWSQIEALVYQKLDISKETFEATYKLDNNTADAKQFEVKDGAYTAATKIGTVSEKKDANDPTTNILSWKLTAEQLHALKDKAATGVTIYVRFMLKGASDESEGVYVPLTIKPNQLHYATASLAGSKVLAQWYNLNKKDNAKADADADEVRINVPVPTKADNKLTTDEFTRDLHNYFLDNTLSYKLNDETHFSALKASATNKLVFKFITPSTTTGNATFNAAKDGTWTVKGYTGTTYTLKVAANGNSIQIVKKGDTAVTEDIVTLDQAGKIKFVESADADDILNYKGHKELGERETFTAYIGLAIDGTCYTVPLNGKTWFNVRFVRPLDLTQPKPAEVKDAPNEWQKLNVDSLVTVNDWRDFVGDPKNANHGTDQGNKFDFAYYGIKLATDATAIYTDAANGVNNRNVLTSAADIEKLYKTSQIPGLLIEKGASDTELKYKNSSAVTGTFHLYVPVKMTYVFGKTPQMLYSVVTVTKTEGQGTAKRR
ncbi:hypothetical protein [Hallella multisaccharivorax]|uniref:hypothetical protein n=1 Tax=Hallella multisaccharivorax TaxID=310514 RepID=UPI0036127004